MRVLVVALGANDGLRGVPVAQLRRTWGHIIERAGTRIRCCSARWKRCRSTGGPTPRRFTTRMSSSPALPGAARAVHPLERHRHAARRAAPAHPKRASIANASLRLSSRLSRRLSGVVSGGGADSLPAHVSRTAASLDAGGSLVQRARERHARAAHEPLVARPLLAARLREERLRRARLRRRRPRAADDEAGSVRVERDRVTAAASR